MSHFVSHNANRFAEDLLQCCISLLQNVRSLDITDIGLKGLLQLIMYSQVTSPEFTFKKLIAQLHSLSFKAKQARSANYNILCAQYNINALVFEKMLFSD